MQKNYTPEQSAVIRNAIREGRVALAKGEQIPRVFASAFLRAGGLQCPGGSLDQETRRRMEGRIMAIINQRGSGEAEEDSIQIMIDREVARIHDEFERFQAMMQPNLTGYRLKIDRSVIDPLACQQFAGMDLFGLGSGVITPHEIVVLPPCCDGAHWEPVYEG
jgi:hypothetical protein